MALPAAAAGAPLQGPSRPPASAAPIVASNSMALMVPIAGAVSCRAFPRACRPRSGCQSSGLQAIAACCNLIRDMRRSHGCGERRRGRRGPRFTLTLAKPGLVWMPK